ncbi:hypothetical protein LPB67_17470 [Undibacterium sp. Jales W-56]|uniref:hypothetical protein n=1 Tax=Undibacterium sp. Jales W-56 TaxID=2897325 RepID=UPI0021D180EA|nr:hypothetical protein [Undibacterium sp. Jales W-56]MCU6435571.1 hypothetical protein [Undibacterium sp. Jales W-56]
MRSHGSFEIYTDGQVLVSEVTGPWNTELVVDWLGAVLPMIQELAFQGPWGTVAIIKNSLLCPKEALQLLTDRARIAVDQYRMVGSVYVAAPDVDGRHFIEPVYAKFYQGICPIQFFDRYPDALAWVRQECRDYAKSHA